MAKKKSMRERMKAKQEELNSRGKGSGNMLYIKEGTMRVRGLFVGQDEDFMVQVPQYYLGKEVGGFISPAAIGKDCPAEELSKSISDLLNDGDLSDDDKEYLGEYISKLKPRKKELMLVMVYEDEKGKKVDKEKSGSMLQLGTKLASDIIELFLDDEWGDFTDIKEGYDLKITRTGKGMNDTSYSVAPCRNTPIKDKTYKKQFNIQEALESCIEPYDKIQEKIDKAFPGLREEIEELSSGGKRTSKKKKKVSSKKKTTSKKKGSSKKRRKSSDA